MMSKQLLLSSIFALLCLCNLRGQGASNTSPHYKHQIKVNSFYLISSTAIEGSYEYLINTRSSIGVSISSTLDNSRDDLFWVIPYYKFFFEDIYGIDFFVEPHLLFGQDNSNYFTPLEESFAFGTGLSIGGRHYRKRLVVEPIIGVGRVLNSYDGSYTTYPRATVNIGVAF